ARQEPNAEVRMALVGALRKVDPPGVGNNLAQLLADEPDSNVKVAAWGSLQSPHYGWVQQQLLEALYGEDVNVANAASRYAARLDTANMSRFFGRVAMEKVCASARANLLGLAVEYDYLDAPVQTLAAFIKTSNDRYVKAAYVNALGGRWEQLTLIASLLEEETDPAITTAAMNALSKLVNGGNIPHRFQSKLVEVIQLGFEKQDLATVALASGLVTHPDLDSLVPTFQSDDFRAAMQAAYDNLELPQDVETLMALQSAMDYLTGVQSAESVVNPFNHPINWDR
ncbi:MAG TPA: hypothetical protein DCP28_10375, partial [Cytophagales bacterium]|nr:hypothetical protein [Cytophagales bacterium]